MIFSIKLPVYAVVAVNVVLKEVDVDAVVVAHIFLNKAAVVAVHIVLNEVDVDAVPVFAVCVVTDDVVVDAAHVILHKAVV